MTTGLRAPRRRFRLGLAFLTLIVLVIAIVTLLGLEPLVAMPADVQSAARSASTTLIRLVSVIGALAVLIGAGNLLRVNLGRLSKFPQGMYSLLTVITLLAILGLRIAERLNVVIPPAGTPAVSLTVLDVVQVTVESALAGILFFFLIYAAYRLMRRGVSVWNILFIAALILVLIGYAPLTGMQFMSDIRDWLLRVPVNAGTRGLLLGVALGTLIVGVRILIGQHRTFRD
jgi:hypothetical protein